MTYKTKKKLIHFYTTGAVAEDFAASKKRKLAKLRKIIRTCFYVQLGVCVICAAIGFISGFSGAVPVAICTGILLVAAFFAAGENALVHTGFSCRGGGNYRLYPHAGARLRSLRRDNADWLCGGLREP